MARPAKVAGMGADTAVGTAGRALVLARLADVRHHEAGVARLDVEAVHDMRVATRRLRAALKLFARGEARSVDREVKRLQDALGDVRDVQVQLAWLADVEAVLRTRERPVIRAWISRGLGAHRDALRDALAFWSGEVAGRVESAAAAVEGRARLGGGKMARRLARRERRVARRAGKAHADPSPLVAHELRIAAKKLRYTAELLERGFPGRVKLLLAALVPLQKTLGELHDADVRIERLGGLAARGDDVQRRGARRLLEVLAPQRERLANELVGELPPLIALLRSRDAS